MKEINNSLIDYTYFYFSKFNIDMALIFNINLLIIINKLSWVTSFCCAIRFQ